jgi:hypothetical protein
MLIQDGGSTIPRERDVILSEAPRRSIRRAGGWREVEGSAFRRANVATRTPVLTGQ